MIHALGSPLVSSFPGSTLSRELADYSNLSTTLQLFFAQRIASDKAVVGCEIISYQYIIYRAILTPVRMRKWGGVKRSACSGRGCSVIMANTVFSQIQGFKAQSLRHVATQITTPGGKKVSDLFCLLPAIAKIS